MKVRLSERPLRVLDFDLENRPLSYWYDGQCTAEITAIACSWVGEDEVYCWQLWADEYGDATSKSAIEMLLNFRDFYDQADVVTGHYIRRHDLPILNAGYLEYELPLLGEKLTSDTKLDLVKRSDLATSQEALGAMYGLDFPKVQMTQQDWRDANRRTPKGIQKEFERVTGDVRQHKALRTRLIEAGALKPPKMWRP